MENGNQNEYTEEAPMGYFVHGGIRRPYVYPSPLWFGDFQTWRHAVDNDLGARWYAYKSYEPRNFDPIEPQQQQQPQPQQQQQQQPPPPPPPPPPQQQSQQQQQPNPYHQNNPPQFGQPSHGRPELRKDRAVVCCFCGWVCDRPARVIKHINDLHKVGTLVEGQDWKDWGMIRPRY